MNGELIFRVIYAGVYLSALLVRVYHSRKASAVIEKNFVKRWKKAAEQEGKLSTVLWSTLPFFLMSFALLYVVLHSGLIARSVIPLPTWSRWIGVGLGTVAMPFSLWVHQTIGEYWIAYLDLREHHRLVMDGPYRWVRHPMYLQSIMLLVALSLVSANLLMVLSSIVTIILILNRIPKEERMMMERFGDEYRDYVGRTGRLLPRFIHEAD